MEFNGLINYLEINNSFKEKFFSFSFKDEQKNGEFKNNNNKDDF
jgi:hypothetical protein